MRTLRDNCPCAGCKGESVLFAHYTPPEPDTSAPGRYILDAAETVGSYAIQFRWGDGHNQGLYTWDYLRSLCECEDCRRERR